MELRANAKSTKRPAHSGEKLGPKTAAEWDDRFPWLILSLTDDFLTIRCNDFSLTKQSNAFANDLSFIFELPIHTIIVYS